MLFISDWLGFRPSRERFAREVQRRLQASRAGTEYEYLQNEFSLRSTDGQSVYLGNLYEEYCRTSVAARRGHLNLVLRGLTTTDIPEAFELARDKLYPVLRSMSGLDMARLSHELEPKESVFQAFPVKKLAPDLGLGVGYDGEHAIVQVGPETIAKWGISLEDLLAIAVVNLRNRAAPAFTEKVPGLYISNYGDFFDAARICLPDVLRALKLDGDPVVMMPNRVCLLVAGHQDQHAIAHMLSTAAQVLSEPRPLSSTMLRLSGTEWAAWQPKDAENAATYATMQRAALSGDYQEQKTVLDGSLERAGRDIYVAIMGEYEKDGATYSYSVLPYQVPTWLPRSDMVMVQLADDMGTVRLTWDQFASIAEDALESLGYLPERYRLRAELTPDQFKRVTLAGEFLPSKPAAV